MSSTSIPQQYPDQPTNSVDSYTALKSALGKLKVRSQLLEYSGGLLLWLASVSLLLLAWLPLGGVLRLPIIVRVPVIAIWIGCAIWAGYVFVVKTLMKHTSVERMAFRLEQHYPELQDRIISSLQLWPELSENKYGYSKGFIARVVDEAHSALNKIDRSKVLTDDLRKLKRAGLGMIGAVLPLIILIALFPATFGDSLYAFVHPFEGSGPGIPILITSVVPGDYKLPHGDDLDISADVTGPAPPAAVLHHKTGKGEWRTMSLIGKEEGKDDAKKTVFTTKLQNIKESMNYYVSAADAQSQQYSITIIHRPIISKLQLELHYPKYTGRSPQSLGENTGDVIALLGTKVVITADSSKDIASAFAVFDDTAKTRLDIKESRTLTGSFLVQKSGTYYISMTDTDGQSNSDPIKYSINALADQPPRISIVQPGQDTELGENMTVPLQIEAQDDYGIATIKLHYEVEKEDEKHSFDIFRTDSPQADVSLSHAWDLTPLRLFPEDVVSYYAEAADADNISGPNIGRSRVFTIRLPSLYEVYKDLEDDQELQQLGMEDVRSQQDDVKDMVDDLISELKKEKELDWAGKKELERAAELQKQIEEKTKDLAQQINETVKKMEENPLMGMEALEKIQELRNLMNEVATEEMKQIMRKLAEAMEQANPSQQQRDLMSASFKQEEFMEKLDRMIDLFKKMQLEQKLEVAANQAEELVRQQTETLEQSEQLAKESTDDPETQTKSDMLADREMRIKEQTEQLLNDLDALAEEMKEEIPNIAENVEKLTEQAKQAQIPEELQRASSALNRCCSAESLPHQRNALSEMSQLQSDLQEAQEAMKGQDAGELTSALRDAIRSSLYLSHRHEEVMQATTPFEDRSDQMLPKESEIIDSLAADEIDLAEGAQRVADQLRELSHKSTSIRPELVWNLERVADGMKRAAAAMEDKLPALVSPIQRNTLASLNRAIEDMLKSIDQINSQAMPMMGMEDYMEQLQQLAEQQSQLNESTQAADSIRRRQGMTPSVEEMLEKLSIEQSLIREATERLAAKLDELAETMGRLEEVARNMQEVEESLRSGDVSGNTIEKQRRILTRLLDYEKSLKRQDFSKKREARAGRDYAVAKPDSIIPEDTTRIREQLDTMLSPSVQEQWPEQYRELIKMYYKALSNTVRTQN